MKIIKNILFPMKFTSYSLDILEYAIILSRSLRAKLHLLHVIAHDETPSFDALNEFFYTTMSDAESGVSRNVLDQVDLVKVHIKDEAVWRGIIRYAGENEIDMVMIAAHATGAQARDSLDEIVQSVLAMSPCPVMVVQWPEERSKHQSRFELTLQEIKKEISTHLS